MIRSIVRQPGFAAVVALSLALGIGANTAIFSILDALLLRDLPVRHPEQLVSLLVTYRNGAKVPVNYPFFQGVARAQRVFSGYFAWTPRGEYNVEANGAQFLADVRGVTGDFFGELGAIPLLGRFLAPEDRAPVAVIGYGFWERRFGRDPAIIGHSIRIENQAFTIIGVTRQTFFGITPGEPPDIVIPIATRPFAGRLENRAILFVFSTGRLKPGITPDQARAQLMSFWPDLLAGTVPTATPGPRRDSYLAMRPDLIPTATGISTTLRTRFRQPLYVLMGVVALILLIACVNLANLTLARAAARRHEMTVRLALGASRLQIVGRLLAESLALSAAGSLLALAVGYGGGQWLVRLMAQNAAAPIALDLRPDWRVFAFAALAALLTGVLIGIAGAWQMSQASPAAVLRRGDRSVSGGGRLGRALMVTQVALSLVSLLGAGLLLRAFENLRASDPGFRETDVLEVTLQSSAGDTPIGYRRQLIDRLAALPGVLSVGFANASVPAGAGWRDTVSRVDADGTSNPGVVASMVMVSPGFFRTLGISLTAGRDFDWSDDEKRPPVVITAGVAVPIGQHVRFGVQPGFQDMEVVGVAANARLIDLRDAKAPVIFAPFSQHSLGGPGANLFLRASPAITKSVTNEIASLGREYALSVKTLAQQADESLLDERAIAMLASFFAGVALLLVGIGLFGLMSYTVTRRTREIGIRMALGSPTTGILRMILRQTLLLTAAGIAVGVPMGLAATRFISHMLFGISPSDPLTLGAVAAALLLTGSLAGYLPARRATRVDPMIALRCE